MSAQKLVVSDSEARVYEHAAEMMLSIAEVCAELEPDAKEAEGAVAFLRWFIEKAHSERMGAQAGDKAGARGRTLQ